MKATAMKATATEATATKAATAKAAVSVTIRVIARIIAIGIVPVVWIGVVKERATKITKEREPILEAAIVGKRDRNFFISPTASYTRPYPPGPVLTD